MTEKEKELFNERLKKLEKLKALGIDPYPAGVPRTSAGPWTETGRIRALRGHGKIIFGDLQNEKRHVQFAVKFDEVGEAKLKLFGLFDVGDFVWLSGKKMLTRAGVETLSVKNFVLLAKTLRALPEKFHGLKDAETRLRRRYLDMLANPDVLALFRKKAAFWDCVRNFLVKRDFLEVQTPVLETVPGGADATPFITHHNALERDFYLRISLELPLKRLLVGGYEKVFEIGRLFRNEGIDREHLQEYDDLEFYWAYADDKAGMNLVEELFRAIVAKISGSPETQFQGHTLDWKKKWPKVEYFEIFKEKTGLNLDTASEPQLKNYAKTQRIPFEKSYGLGRMIDTLYKRKVRPTLIQPCFLVGHPVAISPLAKLDPKNSKKVLRFQVLAGGTELGNGWAELNDPADQRQRFEEQMKLRAAGDGDAQMMDEDFVEALEYGMPPAVGFGMSERVFAVLIDKAMRETVVFPPMKEEKK